MLKRRPSEYIREMYFTSQPLETSNLKLTQATMEAIKADTQLLFASDWPHWDFDLPTTITNLPFLSEQAKRNILGLNAARLFGFEVPRHKLATGAATRAGARQVSAARAAAEIAAAFCDVVTGGFAARRPRRDPGRCAAPRADGGGQGLCREGRSGRGLNSHRSRAVQVTATETAVAACAMIRAAESNLFDIAMWFRRPVARL